MLCCLSRARLFARSWHSVGELSQPFLSCRKCLDAVMNVASHGHHPNQILEIQQCNSGRHPSIFTRVQMTSKSIQDKDLLNLTQCHVIVFPKSGFANILKQTLGSNWVAFMRRQVTLNVNGLDDVQVNMQKQRYLQTFGLMYGLHARLLSNAVDMVVWRSLFILYLCLNGKGFSVKFSLKAVHYSCFTSSLYLYSLLHQKIDQLLFFHRRSFLVDALKLIYIFIFYWTRDHA